MDGERQKQPAALAGGNGASTAAGGAGPRPRAWLPLLAELVGDGELSVRVQGTCMRPLVEPGRLVRVRRARVYWPGDVVAVVDVASSQVRLHRCIGYVRRAGAWCVLTRPDDSPDLDPPTPVRQVLGRVVGGACDERAASVPWSTRAIAAHSFVSHALRVVKRWLGDYTRILSDRSA